MNLFADESVEQPVVERLREDSHDVVYVAELAPSITDDEVLRSANDRSAVLVTADKFGELVFRQGAIHSGVELPVTADRSSLRSLRRLNRAFYGAPSAVA
ncbi:MAG TPA: DUF5615 family PIN-like protein [Methylomirabilota bacterium]|nr:DUF5615 family PIN-like protein [Methylomirabilota bacterium]